MKDETQKFEAGTEVMWTVRGRTNYGRVIALVPDGETAGSCVPDGYTLADRNQAHLSRPYDSWLVLPVWSKKQLMWPKPKTLERYITDGRI